MNFARFFARFIGRVLCDCLVPNSGIHGSRFFEQLSKDEIACYTHQRFDENDNLIEEERTLFDFSAWEKYKTDLTVKRIGIGFYQNCFNINLREYGPMLLQTRTIHRAVPVQWSTFPSLEFIDTAVPGECRLVYRESNDPNLLRSTDVLDKNYYKNSVKAQLRMSILLRAMTLQKQICGFFKIITDEPRNEFVPADVNLRENPENWQWLMNVDCSLSQFSHTATKDIKNVAIEEIKRQKRALAMFVTDAKLGYPTFYERRGETSQYIVLLQEYIQLLNVLFCQTLAGLEHMVAHYRSATKDFFKLADILINRFDLE